MTYAGDKTIFDADSHVMEFGDFLDDYLSEDERKLLNRGMFDAARERLDQAAANAKARQQDPAVAAEAEARLMKDKGWMAMGGWDPAERSRVLDLLGFDAQLVFGTFGTLLYKGRESVDMYVGTAAFNRAIADFCAHDPRLLGVANIPLKDPKKATVAATEAIEAGCAAVMVPSTPAGDLAPTHPDLDPFWDVLAESDTPFVLHVGGGGKLLDRAFHNNNMPVTDHLAAARTSGPRTTSQSTIPRGVPRCARARRTFRPFPEAPRRLHRAGCRLGGVLAASSRRRAALVPSYGRATAAAADEAV